MVSLATIRLIIRDYKETDLYDMHRLWSDKKAMYYLEDIATDTIEETKKYLDIGMENLDGHYFCICDKLTGTYMGSIGYTITDTTPMGKIVHMGYMLLPQYHGHGYMPEAVTRVVEFAFKEDDCIRITTGCIKAHKRSRRVMEKAGFHREGERIAAQYHDGEMKDRLEYAINKKSFDIRPIDDKSRPMVTAFIDEHWYGTDMLIRGEVIDMSKVDGYVLIEGDTVTGLVTYIVRGVVCEITSLDSSSECRGVGTYLIDAVKARARKLGCEGLRLMTTNDNLRAFGFYQKRGFELAGVNLYAIDKERESKPSIPAIGQNGIPLHHELDFYMRL